jgi:hypothetical protein
MMIGVVFSWSRRRLQAVKPSSPGNIRSSTIREYSSRQQTVHLLGVFHRAYPVTLLGQKALEQSAQSNVVINNQDLFAFAGHALSHLVQVVSIVAEAACSGVQALLQEVSFVQVSRRFGQNSSTLGAVTPYRVSSVILPGLPTLIWILQHGIYCLAHRQ